MKKDGLRIWNGIVIKKDVEIIQSEVSECGLSCLAMVAAYHGCVIDMLSLRRISQASLRGMSLKELRLIANKLNMATRAVRAEMEDLASLSLPCILHWNLNHFVVLRRVTRRHIEISDPACGFRRITLTVASLSFTGVALELSPGIGFNKKTYQGSFSLKNTLGLTKQTIHLLTRVVFLSACIEILLISGPVYLQWIVDEVVAPADTTSLPVIACFATVLVCLTGFSSLLRSWTLTTASSGMQINSGNKLFKHMMSLRLNWFERRSISDISSRFDSLQKIHRTASSEAAVLIIDGLSSLAILILLAAYNVSLACVVLASIAFYLAIRLALIRPMKRAMSEAATTEARQDGEMLECVRGISAIKLAVKESDRSLRYVNALVDATHAAASVQKIHASSSALGYVVFGITRVGLIAMGARFAVLGNITPGAMLAVVAYSEQLISRSASMIDRLSEILSLNAHVDRVSDIALAECESTQVVQLPILENQDIECRGVGFRYSENDPWIIRNFCATFRKGESVAITGPSGSGKTTLAKILLGLIEPCEGQVLFGHKDIRAIGTEQYRKVVASVMQDDQLFTGSIWENITFFDPSATQIAVELSASAAGIGDDIDSMPMGYETLMGDMGSTVSGGQKQRILLARAIFRQPYVLVLDEATSHLDADRERQVTTSISSMNVTRIVIAHRHETIAGQDRCVDSSSFFNTEIS